ncbi:MAG: hypothetical protein LBL04_17895 [Bacteroidales bacterium]|nr:hypothetical protein [Bacteroidales bacterium]
MLYNAVSRRGAIRYGTVRVARPDRVKPANTPATAVRVKTADRVRYAR